MTANFVFMHGGGQGSWTWNEAIDALKQQSNNNCRTLALDAPGCGTKRNRDTSTTTYAALVDELIADIEAAGMRDVILVGHSQAGCVMPRMAKLRPDLFKRLIYATCSSPQQGQTILEMMGKELRGKNNDEIGWAVDPATTPLEERYQKIFCNDMNSAQSERLIAEMSQDRWPVSIYAQRDWQYEHLIDTPSSYVIFLQDIALPVVWQQRFAEVLHADRVIRIDAGHQGMTTRPHAFAETLLNESIIDK